MNRPSFKAAFVKAGMTMNSQSPTLLAALCINGLLFAYTGHFTRCTLNSACKSVIRQLHQSLTDTTPTKQKSKTFLSQWWFIVHPPNHLSLSHHHHHSSLWGCPLFTQLSCMIKIYSIKFPHLTILFPHLYISIFTSTGLHLQMYCIW